MNYFCTHHQRARVAKKIETPADIEGFPNVKEEDKDSIRKLIAEFDSTKSPAKAGKTGKASKTSSKVKAEGASKATLSFQPLSTKHSGLFVYMYLYICMYTT